MQEIASTRYLAAIRDTRSQAGPGCLGVGHFRLTLCPGPQCGRREGGNCAPSSGSGGELRRSRPQRRRRPLAYSESLRARISILLTFGAWSKRSDPSHQPDCRLPVRVRYASRHCSLGSASQNCRTFPDRVVTQSANGGPVLLDERQGASQEALPRATLSREPPKARPSTSGSRIPRRSNCDSGQSG